MFKASWMNGAPHLHSRIKNLTAKSSLKYFTGIREARFKAKEEEATEEGRTNRCANFELEHLLHGSGRRKGSVTR